MEKFKLSENTSTGILILKNGAHSCRCPFQNMLCMNICPHFRLKEVEGSEPKTFWLFLTCGHHNPAAGGIHITEIMEQ